MTPSPHVFAAIDMGSNTIKVRMWRIDSDGRSTVCHRHRYPARLGRGTFETGRFSPEQIAGALEILREIRGRADELGDAVFRAVGTAAMRAAGNAQELIERAREETEIEIEVIPPVREGELTSLGAVFDLRPPPGTEGAVIDIGGGSAEITRFHVADGGTPAGHQTITLPLGAVRLTEAHLRHDPPRPAELDALRATVETCLTEAGPDPLGGAAIGCGGALVSLGMMAERHGWSESADACEGVIPPLNVDVLHQLIDQMIRLSASERAQRFDLELQRAEIIVAGALALEGVAQRLEVKQVQISSAGNREGLLAEHLASL